MKSAAKVVSTTVILFVLVGGVIAWQAVRYADTPAGGKHDAKITVEKGTSLGEIAKRLAAKGIIDHPSWFRFYANERGLAQKIRAGQYPLSSEMSPRQVLD